MAKATIFVGDLSRFCSDEDITSLFLPYGRVLETKIMRNPVTGISLGYGFLIMGSAESATLAMQCLHGIQLRGRPLRVKWAGRNIKNELAASYPARTARDPSVETVINSVHVRFQALHVSLHMRQNGPKVNTCLTLLFYYHFYYARFRRASSLKNHCFNSSCHSAKLLMRVSKNPMLTN